MPVNLIKRYGLWHIDDTLGPPGRRIHVRQSTRTAEKAKAQRIAAQIERKIWDGHFDGPAAILTFGEALRIYRAAKGNSKFLDDIENYILPDDGPALVDMLAKDIKASTLKRMATDLFPENSGASMNRRALTPAQSVINHCAEAELCPPLMIKNRFEEDSEPKEPATLEWVQAFRGSASEVLGTYALFMILTGCRPSEALAIDKERDLDLVSATVIIRNTKQRGQHKGKRRAHLPEMLVAALANMPTEEGRPLFWYLTYQTMLRAWDTSVERAGIKRLTPHCCRHGAVTQLLRSGLDPVTVGWLVDMTAQMVIETYGHAMKDATLTDRITNTKLSRAFLEVVENSVKTGTSGI